MTSLSDGLTGFFKKVWMFRKLLFIFLFIVLSLMLWTWSPLDESWFRTSSMVSTESTHNVFGVIGAQIADALYILFGYGAWLFVLLCLQQISPKLVYVPSEFYERPHFQRVKSSSTSSDTLSPRVRIEAVFSFILLLLATCAFFSLFFEYVDTQLPEGMGGVIGNFIADQLVYIFGSWISFVVLLVMALSASSFFNFSWFNVCEAIGSLVLAVGQYVYLKLRPLAQKEVPVSSVPHKQVNLNERHEDGHIETVSRVMNPYAVDTPTEPSFSSEETIVNASKEEPVFQLSGTDNVAKEDVSTHLSSPIPSQDEREIKVEIEKEVGSTVEMQDSSRAEATFVPAWKQSISSINPTIQEETTSELSPSGVDEVEPSSSMTPVVATPKPSVLSVEKASEIASVNPLNASHQDTLFKEFKQSDMPAPPVSLLDPAPIDTKEVPLDTIEFTSRLIEKKLAEFNIQVEVKYATTGPVITRYEFEPGPGVKGNKIVNHSKDLARSLSLEQVRIVETIPGKRYMGVELPNPVRQVVHISEIIGSQKFADAKSKLTVALGKDIAGHPVILDIASTPHLLVAGTTGSGKSVGMNAMIVSILYKAKPSEVKMIMIDPKMLEMSVYEDIPHLLAPVITDTNLALNALNWCVGEMERRYRLMSHVKGRNIRAYNEVLRKAAKAGEPIRDPFWPTEDKENAPILEPLPYIVIFVDELADLIMSGDKSIEQLIVRLAQKARAAGMHLVLATQRPSVDVVTGLIKANVPARIAFQVANAFDSKTILGSNGAETLLGKGDMLLMTSGSSPMRAHCAFVSDDEVQRVVDYVRSQGEANYTDGILDYSEHSDSEGVQSGVRGSSSRDELYDEAVALVIENERASISFVQRKLSIGYNRAASIFEQMEEDGVVAKGRNGSYRLLAPKHEE